MSTLDKIALRRAPLSGRVMLVRFGKSQTEALETRDVMNEFWQSLVAYAFDGKMPEKGDRCEVKFGGGDEQFTLLIERDKEARP